MTRTVRPLRHLLLGGVSIAAGAVAACAGTPEPSGLGASEVTLSADTVVGTGQLAELQQRRAAWIARGIDNYRFQLRIVCFCAGDITRPVLVEVRRGSVSRVWDLETGRSVADLTPYPTVTKLFDAAIAERSRDGNVSVTYDRALGYPARIEIGTIANDAGTVYLLGELTEL